jgi:hypothetical protein
MLKLHHHLNPAYTPSTAQQLATTLLNKVYDTVKREVNTIINKNSTLDVTFNEINNVNNKRILNIIISTKRGILYYLNLVLPPKTASC